MTSTYSFNDYEFLEFLHESDFPHMYNSWLDGTNRCEYQYMSDTYDQLLGIYSNRILQVDSEIKAKEFVNHSLTYMTKTELAQCYFNISNKNLKQFKKKVRISKSQLAGAMAADKLGPIISIDQENTYKFLLVMDSIHDFKELDNDENGMEIPTIPFNLQHFIDRHRDSFPIGFDENLVKTEEKCIKKLSELPKLTYLNGTIEINPFYNIDTTRFDIYDIVDKNPGMYYKDLLKRSIQSSTQKALTNNTFSVDIFTSKSQNNSALKLEDKQLYRLIGYMNTHLGFGEYDTMEFQIDNISNTFNNLLFSISYINSEVKHLFEIDDNAKTFLEINQIYTDDVPRWIVKYSDANIFDPANRLEFPDSSRDERITGCIYRSPLTNYQVFLDGAKRIVPEGHRQPGQFKPSVDATIMDDTYDATYKIDDRLAKKTFSTDAIKSIVDNLETSHLKQNPTELKHKLEKFNINTIYALKRAGDWGQVEHAKQYNKVFITGDRYAALYAYFRKVPVLLHRTAIATNKKRLNLVDIDEYPNFAQYSFIIMNPDRPI